MPLISDTIPNLTGGVSQQADNLRYSNTAEACENAMLSPVTGMQKRQAAEWLGEMHPYGTTSDLALDDKAAVHWIDRDATEHYALTVDSNGLRAFDADTGQAIEVIQQDDVAEYLSTDGESGTITDYANDLRFVTVADTTFLANRNVTVRGSTDTNFLPHHFAEYPHLAYDEIRGGSGVLDDTGAVRFRSGATVPETVYQTRPPSMPAYARYYIPVSMKGATSAALYIEVFNPNNTTMTPQNGTTVYTRQAYRLMMQNPQNGQIAYIPTDDSTYHIGYSQDLDADKHLFASLNMGSFSDVNSWETYSSSAMFTGQHISTRHTVDGERADVVGNTVEVSFTCRSSITFGPNGTYSTFLGRTISHDLRIKNGYLEISDDAGQTYRALRVNDHSTAKRYSGASRRPHDTPDIDFDNVDTSATVAACRSSTTFTWPGGSNSLNLMSSAFMPNNSAQLDLLNDCLWVLALHRANNAETSATLSDKSDAYVSSQIAPINYNGFTHQVLRTGVFQDQVATFQDLPATATGGAVYEVGGTAQGDGAYYVIMYDGDAANDERYIETYETPYVLDEATLPIKIQRLFDVDGNPQFVVSRHKYGPRVCGDAFSNALPSFVDNTINEIFVHSGRLGFLSQENVVLSGTNYGNTAQFFRTTVTQLLDDDRIDLNASTGDVAKLIYAAPFANTLLLFSERAQYRLVSSGALTPATSLIQQTGAYATSLLARPQRVGKSVFAAVNDVERTTVREFRADIDTDILESNEVTTQVPKFIPSDVHKLAYSAKKNILVALSHTNANCLYVYNYYDATNQRLQSAWSKWLLEDDTRIVNVEVLEDNLHLICAVRVPDYVKTLELDNSTGTDFGAYQERTHMVRIPLNEITEVDAKSFPVLADFRVTRAQCINVEGDRQDSADGVGQANQNAFTYSTSSLSSTNLLAIPLPDGLDFSIVELPYKTTATDMRTIFTDADAYGISPPLLAALNIEIDSGSSQAALAAATGTFLASPTQANADAINAIVVNTDNTKVIVIGRLDGVFLTPEDRVLNNITTAVTPNFVMGRAYTLTYEQSPIFYKAGESNVGKTDARLQLRYCTVTCDETSSFDVEVTADGRQMRKYDYEAFKPGVADFTLGTRRFASESFRFPVFAQNQKCKIVFKNSTVLPSTLTSLEWQGFVSPKAVSVR